MHGLVIGGLAAMLLASVVGTPVPDQEPLDSLGGTWEAKLPPAVDGVVKVYVAGSPGPKRGGLPLLFINGLDEPITELEATVSAYGSDGTLLGVGTLDSGAQPYLLAPGGHAIGSAWFGETKLPSTTRYEAVLDYVPAADSSTIFRDMTILEVAITDAGVVGTARNDYPAAIEYPVLYRVTCWDERGRVTSRSASAVVDTPAEPGETVVFRANLYPTVDARDCERFTVSGGGTSDDWDFDEGGILRYGEQEAAESGASGLEEIPTAP